MDLILRSLSDGQFHTGEQLAAALGVSRSAVWQQMRQIEALGLEIFRVPGKGYRFATPLELLDAARIRAALSAQTHHRLRALHVLRTVASTNNWLSERGEPAPAACLAECQRAGRGRHGRNWVSPFGANLYLSLCWQFEELPPGFTALGMVVAIAAVKALRRHGVHNAVLKWPNDVMAGERKLGGVLVDVQGETSGQLRAVIGVGLNVQMPATAARDIDQPWTDVATQCGGAAVSRNALAAALLNELFAALDLFGARGFVAFDADWRRLDRVIGCEVVLQQHEQRITGTALGVDQDGALLIETGGRTQRFVSGEVSVRVRA